MSKTDFVPGTSKVEDFWKFINERHAIYLKRKAKQPKPWSDDPIFQEWKFTNVFRELDRGTIALRQMLKTLYDGYKYHLDLALAPFNKLSLSNSLERTSNIRQELKDKYIRNQFITCILYRLFNWHENVKFGPITNQTAWWHYLRQERDIGNQIFTGAYMQPSVKGEDKLTTFERVGREIVEDVGNLILCIKQHNTLEYAWARLSWYKHIGPFIAYEFVCDLRYTDILRNATDTCTWCNIGPGAERGLQRMGMVSDIGSIRQLFLWSLDSLSISTDKINQGIKVFAPFSRSDCNKNHWIFKHFMYDANDFDDKVPNSPIYPYWELREIEHCLCELDKYERIRLGQGRPRAKFNGV